MSRFDEEPDGYIHGECSMEIERLRTLATCGCGDEFTAHDPGICVNCLAAHDSILHAELETLRRELAACQAREASYEGLLRQYAPKPWSVYPHDDSALRESIAQAKREALDEAANTFEILGGASTEQLRRMAKEITP